MHFSTTLSQLNRVGKSTASQLNRAGLFVANDLLYYFPFRYEDFRRHAPIKDIREGEAVTVVGTLELINNRRTHRRGKNITEALVADDSGSVRVVWFNQPFLIKTLHPGDKISLSGVIKEDILGPQLVSPTYERVNLNSDTTSTGRLVPMYPLTGNITQKQVRFLIKQVLPLAEQVPEWLPSKILEKYDLIPLQQALRGIHFPVDEIDLHKSTERLKFDELFILQLEAELNRQERQNETAPSLTFHEAEIKEFVSHLPFQLTKTQKISAWEILQDIAKSIPMNRLLSGDVGSGKTVVAAMAMYSAALNGYQAVLMAPTEILATQHYASLTKLLEGLPISLGILTANQAAKLQIPDSKFQIKSKIQGSKQQKIAVINELKNGSINIIVGTHALLSEGVDFKKLGLVIVDEQHRFGVEQRKIIKEKGEHAHFLSMTATPIPRSLALMLYGDLDVSIISELPPGRKQIITRLVEPSKREKAYGFIRDQVKNGRQVFVVCPLIEESKSTELLDKKSVLSEYEKLSKKIFPDLRVGFLHGKLKSKEKEEIMNKFKKKEIDILVSTSVVEVGVDIPNASVMMIEGADRFGLAQLHQFRGRVGRSSHQSYCLLFTDSDSTRVSERLKYFEQHHDGFKLAEKDLEMRGPGEVYGLEQSGMMRLRLATLTDREIIKKARAAASDIAGEVNKYPKLLEMSRKHNKMIHLE